MNPVSVRTRPTTKLVLRRELDEWDEVDLAWSEAYKQIEELIAGGTEKEATTTLQEKVSDDMSRREGVTTGLLYGILTDPTQASTFFRFLTLVDRDGHVFCLSQLNKLAEERYPKLLDTARTQLLWLLRKLVELNVQDADGLLAILLRHIIGGDTSQKNIWLCGSVLQLLNDFKPWLFQHASIIPIVFYSYIRLIQDHSKTQFQALRQAEVTFCVQLFRERFTECITIGRDIVRLLQDPIVLKTKEFEAVWNDIYQNPSVFSPDFTGVQQLLEKKTSRRVLQWRLTPQMERQLVFMMKEVKMGNQRHYQRWFVQKWLNTQESESLICDMVRFICAVHHPTNQELQSALQGDLVPRWALIGWLLRLKQSKECMANVKLALFFDWLFFNPKVDNIMNIEPALLLMVHSLPKYATMTSQLLRFLMKIMEKYDVARNEEIFQGVKNSFATLLKFKVVTSLAPLYSSPQMDPAVRERFHELFPQFVTKQEKPPSEEPAQGSASVDGKRDQRKQAKDDVADSVFAQDDIQKEATDTLLIDGSDAEQASDLGDLTEPLPDVPGSLTPLGDTLAALGEAIHGSRESAGELLERVLQKYVDVVDPMLQQKRFQDTATTIAADLGGYLVHVLSSEWTQPVSHSPHPLHGRILKRFCGGQGGQGRRVLQLLLKFMQLQESSIGWRLLAYVVFENDPAPRCTLATPIAHQEVLPTQNMHPYLEFLAAFSSPSTEVLLRDLKACFEANSDFFINLLPHVYRHLRNLALDNVEVLHLIVAVVDPAQLAALLNRVAMGEIQLIEDVPGVISKAMEWESFEQHYLWRIVEVEYARKTTEEAEMVSLRLLDVVPSREHSEALCGLASLLGSLIPSAPLVQRVLCLSTDFGGLPSRILAHWGSRHADTLMRHLVAYTSGDMCREDAVVAHTHLSTWRRSDSSAWARAFFSRDEVGGALHALATLLGIIDGDLSGRGDTDKRKGGKDSINSEGVVTPKRRRLMKHE